MNHPPCRQCRSALQPDAQFCHRCGARVLVESRVAPGPTPSASRAAPSSDTGAKIVVWLLAILGTIFVIGVIIAGERSSGASPIASAPGFSQRNADSTAVQALLSSPDTLSIATLFELEARLHRAGLFLAHDDSHRRFVDASLDSAATLVSAGFEYDAFARGLLNGLNDATSEQRERRDALLARIQARADERREAADRDRRRAVAALVRKTDEFNGTTWYKDPSHPRYSDNKAFRIYIGERDGHVWMRLLIRYSGDDWLFVERFIVLVDGSTYTIDPGGHFDVERNNGGGTVWEWYDTTPTPEQMALIRKVAGANTAKIRFEGQQYYHDWTIPSSQRAALRRVLTAYDALQGSSTQ